MIHPGPQSVAPSTCPDGLVLHIYAVPADRSSNARFLFDRMLTPDIDVINQALGDRERADAMLWPHEDAVCLVIYDGDSGVRLKTDLWGQ